MRASEFLRRYEKKQQSKEKDDTGHKDHSLQAHARERAEHPQEMHSGTAFDWEDLEKNKEELDRLSREGPKISSSGSDAEKRRH